MKSIFTFRPSNHGDIFIFIPGTQIADINPALVKNPFALRQVICIAVSSLGRRLHYYFTDFPVNDLGEILDAPTDVVLTEKDKPQPDILFISKGRLDIITEYNVQGAPDLIIEVLSPSTSKWDKVEKSKMYYKHGVKEYWIADPDSKVIEIFIPGEKNWNLFQAYDEDDMLTSPLLAGLEIPLTDIFRS